MRQKKIPVASQSQAQTLDATAETASMNGITAVSLANSGATTAGTRSRRKQKEPSSSAAPYQRPTPAAKKGSSKAPQIHVPHAATLPRIVWVFDSKHQWWPGKITQYPPKDNMAKVSRFGNVKPKSIVLECSESSILPFEHVSKETLQQQGLQSPMSKTFETAFREATEAQLKDDDGLPSLDDILNHFPSAPSNSLESARKDTATRQRPPVRPDTTYMPDSSLTIPGELILAQWGRLYYPARIVSFNEKSNKYKVEYATGHSLSIERKKFFTRYEKGFQTCQLGDLDPPKDDREDKELESQVRELYPAIYSIIAGKQDEAGRLKAFMKGGRAKCTLSQRVGPGYFNRAEFSIISNMLQSEFLPDLSTTKQLHKEGLTNGSTPQHGTPMKREGDVTQPFSDQMRLHFFTDVLLPETITRLTMRRYNINMEPSARSLLLELMAKSKKGLSFAEQLCSQAREELNACQGHSDGIEKMYSKLCFVSRQIRAQITTVEALLRIARARLHDISLASKDLQRDLNSVSQRMEHALHALRSRRVDSEIQRLPNSDGEPPADRARATALFDFLDEVSLQRLQEESDERLQRIQSRTARLYDMVSHFGNQRTEFKGYLTSAISLDDTALSFARDKMRLQEHQTTSMAESLVSIANHYDQVANVLTADTQPMQEELDVLDSDTALMLVIIEELEESLALVQATSEEVSIREHLYATAYQEAVAFFKKIDALEPDLVKLFEALKSCEGIEEEFDATEKVIEEINSLAIWYEEFHNSYGALTLEVVRRHQVHQTQQRLIRDFVEKMEATYSDEMHHRTVFSEKHGKFLPVDLCPTFAIIIQGFKSYKNQTVIEPFSGQHNVIVGRNGSGKSNFFAAIRFVLSDAYTNMGREERQSLLHEGSGAATMSAYVEIIFDNSDNRFPTGKDELVMRRTIGLKKDEYSLDKKSATKSDVMNMLESAGFSRSNPYYIVPQGRITSLTIAKDDERLQLLKEVAGTRVYEQRRQESLKIITETDTKRKNIEELLTYIEQRLEELNEEKEELKLYQEHDRRRRCLEYTIYSREQKEVSEALEEAHSRLPKMEEEHRQELDGSNQQRKDFQDSEARIVALEQEINEQKQHIELLLAEKRQLDHELESQIKVKAQIELRIKDHEDNAEQTSESKRRNQQELQAIEEEIRARELELSQVTPELQQRATEEHRLREHLVHAEQERQILYSKQGRFGQFSSKAQRNEWIQNEVLEMQKSCNTQTRQYHRFVEGIEALKTKLAQEREKIQTLRDQETARKEENESLLQELVALKAERDQLTDQRKELWREDAKTDSTLNILREEQRKSERSLGASMDKNTSAGLAAVSKIAKALNLDGVYGPLYELFDVEDQYETAVSVTAGSSLFHVVVDTEVTATRVLEALNKEKAGRVTFVPLNRLNPKASTYPEANDAIPMIKKLSFDPKYTKAFQQVFGRALICRTLEIAATYSRSYSLDGITLDGDRIDRKGALTGGFQDTRNTRLKAIKNIKSFNVKYQTAMERCQVIKQEITKLDQQITGLLNKIQLTEVRRKQLADKRDSLATELKTRLKDETSLMETLEAKEKTKLNLQTDIKLSHAQITSLLNEMQSDMAQSLSDAEQRRLREVIAESDRMKERLSVLSTERSKLGTRKNILEITLTSNLRPRLNELRDKIENGNVLDDDALDKRRRDLAAIMKSIQGINVRLQDIDNELEQIRKTVAENESKLEKLQTDQLEESRRVRRMQKDAEKYVSRRNLLLQKKEDCVRSIRELGVLPEEAFEKYKNAASQKLLKQIHKVNEELRKYSHVNKKAFEQFNNFTKQRDALLQRKQELDDSETAIRELIQTLDQRKDEAIERTFKQVARNFAQVFSKLVPAGLGRLIMQRKMDQTPDADEDNDDEHEASAIDNYTGIAIQVSFNSKMDEGLRMQQLSGGQKSLVALTLIFAIQQCDPAPFYLFDEIDANLDAAHRTAVAAMIHSLSEQAQFITTTFRPEMLADADKFYGVTFQNKVSVVNAITKEEALDFVEREQAH
ncbi:Structural maintenance of chromosomes protein 3 [Mortierella alpina]|uniref:Structural maintenance of chromosomes protein 3 n=1 Tax=Mortierella alpina TaxID=64518 RepID=A0A9P6M483_MORAP|nr:Structural maintenance of chromosomes protein 3 [Mortierella alpina]